MDISTLRKGDVLSLEVEVTDRSLSPDGWVEVAGTVALDSDELDKMNAKVVKRAARPVKSGDPVRVGVNGGVFVGLCDGWAVVRSERMNHLYDGYVLSHVSHADGTPILWEES